MGLESVLLQTGGAISENTLADRVLPRVGWRQDPGIWQWEAVNWQWRGAAGSGGRR